MTKIAYAKNEFAEPSQACVLKDSSSKKKGQQQLDGQTVMQDLCNNSQKSLEYVFICNHKES